MANDFYRASGVPAFESQTRSAELRSEFSKVSRGFDFLPGLFESRGRQVVIGNGVVSTRVSEGEVPQVNPALTDRVLKVNSDARGYSWLPEREIPDDIQKELPDVTEMDYGNFLLTGDDGLSWSEMYADDAFDGRVEADFPPLSENGGRYLRNAGNGMVEWVEPPGLPTANQANDGQYLMASEGAVRFTSIRSAKYDLVVRPGIAPWRNGETIYTPIDIDGRDKLYSFGSSPSGTSRSSSVGQTVGYYTLRGYGRGSVTFTRRTGQLPGFSFDGSDVVVAFESNLLIDGDGNSGRILRLGVGNVSGWVTVRGHNLAYYVIGSNYRITS